MKRFTLPLTTAISAAMLASSGCRASGDWQADNNTKVCVDQSGKRMPEDQCMNQPANGVSPYRWYYIARGGYVPAYYSPASGGSYAPSAPSDSYAPAPSEAPPGAITRGGFGGVGEGHAGGGEGEGAGE